MTTLFIVEGIVLVGACIFLTVATDFLIHKKRKKKEKQTASTLTPQERFAEEMLKEAVERRKNEIRAKSLAQPLTAGCLVDKKIRCGRTAVANFWQSDYE